MLYPKPVKVGDVLQNVQITEMSRRGNGIYRTFDKLVVFVEGTKIGDKVNIRIIRVGDTSAVGEKI